MAMDKKTFIAASIASLILAFLVGVQAVRVSEANPQVWNSTEPVKDPPLITVQSPQNTTYLQSEILLNFTIAKPASWRDLNSMEQMREISYTFDGEQHTLWAGKTYSMPKDTYFTSYTFPSPQQFFLVLNVSNGQHLLQISAFGVSTYVGNIVPWAAYYPLNASETIAFSVYGPVSASPSSTPSQTLTISPTDTSTSTIESSFANDLSGPAPPIPFQLDFQGFTNMSVPPSSFPMMILRQGETGTLEVNLTREGTNDNVSVRLWFYGIAPNFDHWQNTWDPLSMSLPTGVTCSLEPTSVFLSSNDTVSTTLAITAASNVRVGDYKVMLDAWFSPSHSGNGTSGTGKDFTLEIIQGAAPTPVAQTGNSNLTLETAVLVVIAIVVVGLLVYFGKRRG